MPVLEHDFQQVKRASAAAVARVYDALGRALPGGGVSRDPERLAGYGADESGAGTFLPELVAWPRSTEDVVTILQAAFREGVPVTPRGGGSGRAGGALPVAGGLVLAMEKMNRIQAITPASLIAECEPGVITGELQQAVEAEGLFYPPDPNSLEFCHLGGNVATNAAGPRAVKYGVTRDYVRGLTVVLPSGEVIHTGGKTLKSVAGYDLTGLMVGSEGTLGVVTGITVRLKPRPSKVETALLFFPDVALASRAALAIFRAGHLPRTMELMDHVSIDAVRPKAPFHFPEGTQTAILLELDGDGDAPFEALVKIGELVDAEYQASQVLVAKSASERADLWASRRIMSPSLRELYGHKYAEDVAVPLAEIPAMVDEVHAIAEDEGLKAALYGHMGDGNLHVNLLFGSEDLWPAAMRAAERVFEAAVRRGGTITGEHGVGLVKRSVLPLEQGAPLIALQRRLKHLFDPDDLLNPGKVLPVSG